MLGDQGTCVPKQGGHAPKKSKDCSEVTLGNIRRAITEEAFGLVNISRDQGWGRVEESLDQLEGLEVCQPPEGGQHWCPRCWEPCQWKIRGKS
jgi:hypothetical protein